MRRKDREITDRDQIMEIVRRCSVVHVGMVQDGKPYVVAMNFGWERQGDDLVLYLHSAYEGRKMEALRQAPDIFWQMDCDHELAWDEKMGPCACSWRYASVTGSGRVAFVEDPAAKAHALNCLLGHLQGSAGSYTFPPAALQKTCVWRVVCTDVTGKRHI